MFLAKAKKNYVYMQYYNGLLNTWNENPAHNFTFYCENVMTKVLVVIPINTYLMGYISIILWKYACIFYIWRFRLCTYMYSVLHAENEKVYYARPSELLYGELLPRYIASVLSVYKQAKQSDP